MLTGKSQHQDTRDLEEKRILERLDYIFGPVADGRFYIPKGWPNVPWEPQAFDPMWYQLCLKNKEIADAFYNYGKNVYKTIFFYDTN